MKSKRPGKQRKMIYDAPLHRRHKLVSGNLSKDLRKQLGKRSLPVRTGDEVKIMRGKFKGTIGKISRVDLKKLRVYVENVKRNKATGEETQVSIHPSNLMILNPIIEDSRRKKAVERGKKNEKA